MSAIVGRNKEVDELKTQIDLLIQRKDNVVNMCEMKFYSDEFAVDKSYHTRLVHRMNTLVEKVNLLLLHQSCHIIRFA